MSASKFWETDFDIDLDKLIEEVISEEMIDNDTTVNKTEVLQEDDSEKDELYFGIAEFDAVDSKSNIMKFKVSGFSSEDGDIYLDRQTYTGVDVLISGREYKFYCTKNEEGRPFITRIEPKTQLITNDYTEHKIERDFGISPCRPELFSEDIPDAGNKARVGLFLTGFLENVKLEEKRFTATIKYKRKTYQLNCDTDYLTTAYTMEAFEFIKKYAAEKKKGSFNMTAEHPVAIFGVLVDSTVYVETVKMLNTVDNYIGNEWPEDVKKSFRAAISRAVVEKKEALSEYAKGRSVYPLASKSKGRKPAEFRTYEDLKLKFEACKRFLPESVQLAVEKTLKDGSLKENHRRSILDMLLNTDWDAKLSLCTDMFALKKGMDETHYGMEALKNKLVKIAASGEGKPGPKGIRLLLVGGAGVGKTSLVKRFSEVYGIPFVKIPLNGVDTPLFLKGTPRLYDNAILGRVARAVREVGNRSLILLDEVDKMSHEGGKDGNPYTALYDLLDSNELFCDEMMECGIDLSDTMFVLTANDIRHVPEPILSRTETFFVPDYPVKDKIHIAREYVIPKCMKEFGLTSENITIDDKIPSLVADRYCITGGIREIENNVRSIMESASALVKSTGKQVKITPHVIEDMLGIDTESAKFVQSDFAGLKNKFKVLRPCYSDTLSAEVISVFDAYEQAGSADKETLRKRLFFLVNPIPKKGAEQKFNLKEIRQKLNRTHIGMEKAKKEFLTLLGERNLANERKVKCILLQGMCGIGKTSVAKALADSMDIPFVKISLNGVTNSEHIKGHDRTYKGAEPGIIVQKLAETGTTEALVLLDEVDKMVKSETRDPYTALLDLLDNTGGFYDSYTASPIDLSSTVFVATSNYIENIPAAVIDRMNVITLDGYTSDEKYDIAVNSVIPNKLSNFGLSDKVTFTKSAIEKLVYEYCVSYGIRDVEKAVDKIIGRIILNKNCDIKEKITVDVQHVVKILGAKPIKRGNVSKISRPGTARALAVSGNAGTTFAVEVTENPYGNGDEITGLPKQSTLDSIKIAKLLVSKQLEKPLPGLHIHFGEGGIEKDGPSAGITIYCAIMSSMLKKPIPNDVGFTGEINVFGDVWAIGGAELKIIAAQNAGCTRVFVPMDNYIQLSEDGKLQNFTAEVIPVSNVCELNEQLFEKDLTILKQAE